VDLVLGLRMAGLGEALVLRARLLDVGRGALVEDFQQTGGADAGSDARAVARRLFPPPAGRSRWWLWAIGGGVVAAVVTALLVAGEDRTGIIHLGDL
jgi:hypothetical protein